MTLSNSFWDLSSMPIYGWVLVGMAVLMYVDVYFLKFNIPLRIIEWLWDKIIPDDCRSK